MKDAIGYAVFGSPRGLQVVSNGLFKSLQLDNALYLKHNHIILQEGEQVLMCKRIATEEDSVLLDGVLVALYQHAWPHGEKRSGGFVGSAICFSGLLPSAQKMSEGLWYLFEEICKQVGSDHRFMSADSTGWDAELPDAGSDFGFLETQEWECKPQHPSSSVALPTTSIKHATPSILYNFCFNQNLHHCDHLYATDSNAVFKRLKENGLNDVAFADMFDYAPQMKRASVEFESLKSRISEKENELAQLESDYEPKAEYLESLENEIKLDESKINEIKKAITSLSLDYLTSISPKYQKKLDDEYQSLIKEKIVAQKDIQRKENEKSKLEQRLKHLQTQISKKEGEQKINRHAQTLEFIANELREANPDNPNNELKDVELVRKFFEDRKERREKRLRRRLARVGWISGVLLIVLLGVWFYLSTIGFTGIQTKSRLSDQSSLEEQKNQLEAENKNLKDRRFFFEKIAMYHKRGSKADPEKFRIYSDTLLTRFLSGKYEANSPEQYFITTYDWEFWEFDYTNDSLVLKLKSTPHGDTHFVNLNGKRAKVDSDIFTMKWLQEGELGLKDFFSRYLNQPNDFYSHIVTMDNGNTLIRQGISMEALEKHFRWMLERSGGGPIKGFAKGQDIKAPYFYIN